MEMAAVFVLAPPGAPWNRCRGERPQDSLFRRIFASTGSPAASVCEDKGSWTAGCADSSDTLKGNTTENAPVSNVTVINDSANKDKGSGIAGCADSTDTLNKGKIPENADSALNNNSMNKPTETLVPSSVPLAPFAEALAPASKTAFPGATAPAAPHAATVTPKKTKRKNVSVSPLSADAGPSASPSVNNCAKCKKHTKGCQEGCVFAPYFPADRSEEFDLALEVFGVNKIEKLLRQVTPEERPQVHRSLVFEASAWMNNPVRGPLGVVEGLQRDIQVLKEQLASQQEQLLQQQQQSDDAPAAEELQQPGGAPPAAED